MSASMTLARHVVTMYSIRNQDGDRDTFIRREMQMAQRWNPPAFDKVTGKKGQEENAPGIRVLHDLNEGAQVTEDRIRIAVDMLAEARRYYIEEAPWEPYEGRNIEAASDMSTLIFTLLESIQ